MQRKVQVSDTGHGELVTYECTAIDLLRMIRAATGWSLDGGRAWLRGYLISQGTIKGE